jgi:hypothetical protein
VRGDPIQLRGHYAADAGPLVKVRILRSCIAAGAPRNVGEIVEVSKSDANMLCHVLMAERVEE